MKIICVDNFDRDTRSNSLVCENISPYYGSMITKFLNEKLSCDSAENYYKLVEDSHKLYVYDPT